MKGKTDDRLKRCSECGKPLRHFNKTLLCSRHRAKKLRALKMDNPAYRARVNEMRRKNYHTKRELIKSKGGDDNVIPM